MNKDSNQSMFFGAKPAIFERACALRECMTEAEDKLWKLLSKNKIAGLRFKAQHPIDRFIADFYCHKFKLVVEVDVKYMKTPRIESMMKIELMS